MHEGRGRAGRVWAAARRAARTPPAVPSLACPPLPHAQNPVHRGAAARAVHGCGHLADWQHPVQPAAGARWVQCGCGWLRQLACKAHQPTTTPPSPPSTAGMCFFFGGLKYKEQRFRCGRGGGQAPGAGRWGLGLAFARVQRLLAKMSSSLPPAPCLPPAPWPTRCPPRCSSWPASPSLFHPPPNSSTGPLSSRVSCGRQPVWALVGRAREVVGAAGAGAASPAARPSPPHGCLLLRPTLLPLPTPLQRGSCST
jgi:hypothetical protein